MKTEREDLRYSGVPGQELPNNNILFGTVSIFKDDSSALAQLLESIPTAMFVTERSLEEPFEWTLIGLNSLHNSLSSLGNQVGKTFDSWCTKDQREFLYENYALAIDSWEQINYVEMLDLPGGQRWWQTSLMPIKSESGRYRIVGSALDITHTRHTEGALSTFMPICSVCKSVRVSSQKGDDSAPKWIKIEKYLQDHRLSHGYCDDCFERLYGHLKT